MSPDVEYKELPGRDDDMGFGCSPINPYGLHMKFFSDGEFVFSELSVADYLSGWQDFVHGGVISTILDETMGRSAVYLLKKVCLSKSMEVNFLKSAHVGNKLRAEARVLEVRSEREAVMQATLIDNEGNICARAKGTWALFDPLVALKLGIIDEIGLDSMELRPAV